VRLLVGALSTREFPAFFPGFIYEKSALARNL
jgi:hypothetical protein